MAAKKWSQFELAQRMYSPRAAEYEESWHPQYTERFMKVVGPTPGDRILVLACGTGLETVIAVSLVGEDGLVVGVDATAEMLAEARKKQDADPTLSHRLSLIQHDIADLSSCPSLEKANFDIILCSNAFVLLDSPKDVVAHWRDYLKPGGRMVIDIPHEHNLRPSLLLERVALRLGVAYHSNRLWIESKESFREVLEAQGLVVDRIEIAEKDSGKGTQHMDVTEADKAFDTTVNSHSTGLVVTDDFKAKARPVFREEWEAAAVGGKVAVTNYLYVYVARKSKF